MRWKGETGTQWRDRVTKEHRHFCWLPRQMSDGTWIWLEHCYRRLIIFGAFSAWVYRSPLDGENVDTPPPVDALTSRK